MHRRDIRNLNQIVEKGQIYEDIKWTLNENSCDILPFSGKRPLTQKTYKRLKRNKRLLILTIKWTKYVSNEVQKRNILTKTDLDNIVYRRTPSEKKAALLDAIMRRSEEDLETLKQILEKAKQETAAKLLYEGDDSLILGPSL